MKLKSLLIGEQTPDINGGKLPLVESFAGAFKGSKFEPNLSGGLMPPVPLPPMNLNLTTSSEAKTGAQTGGGFYSAGINFGTAGAPVQTNWLLIGAVAAVVYFLARK